MHSAAFGGLALWALAAATSPLGMGLAHRARLVHVTALSIGVIGAVPSSGRVHRALLTLMGVPAVVTFAMHVGPDWPARP